MPRCAAFVDALREAFGVAEINSVIKRGLRMECADGHRVWFSEAGHVLGRQAADAAPASNKNLESEPKEKEWKFSDVLDLEAIKQKYPNFHLDGVFVKMFNFFFKFFWKVK
jgi:hypothetical protein